jgi:diguanylate cyclase (GGDEF)-like protein
MSKMKSATGRPQEFAYFISGPLVLLTAALLIPLGTRTPPTVHELPLFAVYLVLFVLAQWTVLQFEVRRQTVQLSVTEIPLLLALLYLSPVMVVAARVLALVIIQVYQRFSAVRMIYNVATVAIATTIAELIVKAYRPATSGPLTWLVLAAGVFVATAVTLGGVLGVVTLVQGLPPLRSVLRSLTALVVVAAFNITVALVVLVAWSAEHWSLLLFAGIGAVLLVVYRSYSQFVIQHRTLTELYDLTRAMGDSGRDGTLPDVLLAGVRELLQAESATLWLPPQGRYPEMMLSARVDAPGLIDESNTPAALRDRAVDSGETVAVGPKLGDPAMRALIRDSGVKDAIVVPLRSGSVVIGSLEVTSRLGDVSAFRPADVRLLETLGAHAAVAVENSRLVDRLRFDAYHDPLTGLPNRRRVLALLEEAVKVQAPGEVVAVLAFDIDGLRDVNDLIGHDAGDSMVIEVAARLRALAPAAALVGRGGSDEFLVTVRLPSAEDALRLATKLRISLQEPMQVESVTLDVDVSAGVAVYPDHGIDAELVLKRADLAAQTAKQLANPVQLFHSGLQARSTHRLGLAAQLRRALESGEIEVYFQPKVALPDRRVVGVECLARWDHPTHGIIPPLEFVAVAKHTGQLGRLTEVVLREGLRRARGWLEAGHPIPVAINLSARTLIDPTFPSRISELLLESRVPASLLTLEITEDGVVGEPDRAMATLNRLSEMGVRLAVDDFGTGFSSLSYLRRLPVDEVKIDQSFVQGMATDAGDLAIVRAVVDLAHHFGLVAVAEGVESERTVNLLEGLGCDIGQGFLFSRPLPFERFEAWLAVQTEPVTVEPGAGPQVELGDGEIIAAGRRLRAVP